jgi:hypothetical protein
MRLRHILANAIVTPDGTRLQSFDVHDYKLHRDKNGETYFVDGGLDYIRRSLNKEPAQDCCIYDDSRHEEIREGFHWGTYGKTGRDPFKWVQLSEMTDEHIEKILETQGHLPAHIRNLFKAEQAYRNGTLETV